MKKQIFPAIALMFVITISKAQVISNGGFEFWDTVYTNTYSAELADTFGVPNPFGGIVNGWTASSGYGISRTTDSHSGNYSLILHNWYTYIKETVTYHNAINFTPQYLQGYYKYNTYGSSQPAKGEATVTLTRFDGTSTDTIAIGFYLFEPSDEFIPFQLNIGLTSEIADSVSISIINAGINNTCQNNICNLLYLDDLTLSVIPLTTADIISNNEILSLFPNPVTSLLQFHIPKNNSVSYQITDVNGKVVQKENNISGNTIHLSQLNEGLYHIWLSAGDKFYSSKFIKQ
jgi:hypothetical protein